LWTIRGKHKITQEAFQHEVNADTAADARTAARAILKDTGSPFQWELSASAAVPGLGRNKRWSEVS